MMTPLVKVSRALVLLVLILGCTAQMRAQCTGGSISGGSGFYSLLITSSGNVFMNVALRYNRRRTVERAVVAG